MFLKQIDGYEHGQELSIIGKDGSPKHDGELLNEIGRETQLCVDSYVNSAELKGLGPRN